MVYVCLAEAAALAAAIIAFCGLLRSSSRAHARREDLLVNQLMHATGHTWSPPPKVLDLGADDSSPLEVETWSATPEQWPVF
jgi:hypothetical protein